MGRMQIGNPGGVLGDYSRDGRAFAHYIENLRDALLNGAKRFEAGMTGFVRNEAGEIEDRRYVLRRTFADDGYGMSEKTLKEVYSHLSITGTEIDFAVTANPDASVNVDFEKIDPDDRYNARRGFGGRASLFRFNKMGVVTVTIQDGVARLVQMYADLNGDPRMREFREETPTGAPVKASIVEPYMEQEEIVYEDLIVDRAWALQLMVRCGMCTSIEEAEDTLEDMSPGEYIPNPYDGIDWGGEEIIPAWIGTWNDEARLYFGPDGQPAHGTVKVLLGNTPHDSTAVVGDPFYDTEAVPSRANGVYNRFFTDLSLWDVRVHSVAKRLAKREGRGFSIVGLPDRWRLDQVHGRSQRGAVSLRTEASRTEEDRELPRPNKWQGVLDLGKYGEVIVLYRHEGKPKEDGTISKPSGPGLYGSSRWGISAVSYGLELHGLRGENTVASKSDFITMGFPVYNDDQVARLSAVFLMPRIKATQDGAILVSGIHQSSARDRIKWNGEDLPLGGDGGLFRAVSHALKEQAPELLAMMKDENKTSGDVEVDLKDLPVLTMEFEEMIRPQKPTKDAAAAGKGDERKLITDDGGDTTGTPTGPQGKPGDTEKKKLDCPHAAEFGCGDHFHGKDCPLFKGSSGGQGGTKGGKQVADPSSTGARTRTSQATRRRKPAPKPVVAEKEIPPSIPNVQVVDAKEYGGNLLYPAYWVGGADVLNPATGMQTGTIFVNRDHAMYRVLEEWALEAVKRRDKEDIQYLLKKYISTYAASALLVYLSFRRIELVAEKQPALNLDDLVEALSADGTLAEGGTGGMFWIAVFDSMLHSRISIREMIAKNSAASESVA